MGLLLLQTTDFWKGYNDLSALTQGDGFVLPPSSEIASDGDPHPFDAWEAGDGAGSEANFTTRGTYMKNYFTAYEDNLLGWYLEMGQIPADSHFAYMGIKHCVFWYSTMLDLKPKEIPSDWMTVPGNIATLFHYAAGG